MSMGSRSSVWFGCDIPDDSTDTEKTTPAATPIASTPLPDNQFIYERYFQKVTLRDFQHSTLLLQYATERAVTPEVLWRHFLAHVSANRIDNNLANLIEYLSISKNYTSRASLNSSNPFNEYVFKGNAYPEEPKISYYAEEQISYLEYNRRTYPLPYYTREDFLRSKREAEEEFERNMAQKEEKNKKENEEGVRKKWDLKEDSRKKEKGEERIKKVIKDESKEVIKEGEANVTESSAIHREEDISNDYE